MGVANLNTKKQNFVWSDFLLSDIISSYHVIPGVCQATQAGSKHD